MKQKIKEKETPMYSYFFIDEEGLSTYVGPFENDEEAKKFRDIEMPNHIITKKID